MKKTYYLIIILIIELFLIFQFTTRIVVILQTSTRIDSKRIQRDLVLNELKQKEDTLSYVRTDMYVEEIAREKLRYSKDGETIYVVNKERVPTPVLPRIIDEHDVSFQWWNGAVRWFNLFFN